MSTRAIWITIVASLIFLIIGLVIGQFVKIPLALNAAGVPISSGGTTASPICSGVSNNIDDPNDAKVLFHETTGLFSSKNYAYCFQAIRIAASGDHSLVELKLNPKKSDPVSCPKGDPFYLNQDFDKVVFSRDFGWVNSISSQSDGSVSAVYAIHSKYAVVERKDPAFKVKLISQWEKVKTIPANPKKLFGNGDTGMSGSFNFWQAETDAVGPLTDGKAITPVPDESFWILCNSTVGTSG